MTSVKKNIIWNLMGNVLPLLAGLTLFPMIISAYGLERFGLLTLAWSLVGYFGLFDLGLSRALTQQVSMLLARGQDSSDIAELVRTSFRLMWILGLVGGAALWLAVPFIVTNLLHVSVLLRTETVLAFSVLSISIPIVVHTSALRGILESLHLFKEASLIRMVMGVGTFLGPFLASFFSKSLVGAIYALILVRIIVWILHIVCVNRSNILNPMTASFHRRWIKPLFQFGSWMTLSNIIGPLMVYLDRFVIASMLGVASVAYYVAPYEVISKLWVVPVAISGVLFPLFAQHFNAQPDKVMDMLDKGVRYVLLLLFPVSIMMTAFSHQWLGLWLGSNFSLESSGVVTWLVAGVIVNSAAQIVFAKVQGAGRSDLTAKLHLLELLPYLLLLWILLKEFGVVGAAMAWCARVVMDFCGLVYIARQLHLKRDSRLMQLMTFTLACALIILLVGCINDNKTKLTIFLILTPLYIWLAVTQMRTDGILASIRNYINKDY